MITTQMRREISVTCELGSDVLQLHRMVASEGMSTLSEYTLDLYSERADLQLDHLLATPITVTINHPRGGQRYFSGLITRFALTGRRGRFATYQATVRPWLWFLTHRSDFRIFQEKSLLDIIETVLATYDDIADIDTSSLSGDYPPYQYCVQYRETDFNFVSRLLEREGIYYYFKHTEGGQTMVLADSYSAHGVVPGYATVPYLPIPQHAMQGSEVVHEWGMCDEIDSGVQLQNSYFDKSATNLQGSSAVAHANVQLHEETFNQLSSSNEREGDVARTRIGCDFHHTSYQRAQGATSARGLFPGCLFKLTEHPRSDQNREFLVVAANYTLTADTYERARPIYPMSMMTCSFSAIATPQKYLPAQLACKPVVQGPLTAIVVGKTGQEIPSDQDGRIEVQFLGSTGHVNKVSSCWVRVTQSLAEGSLSSLFVLRGGQKVIVSFLEGDPDRPLLIGAYNVDNIPQCRLPSSSQRRCDHDAGITGNREDEFDRTFDVEES